MYLHTFFVNCTLLWRLGKCVQKRKTDLFWDVKGCSGGGGLAHIGSGREIV